MDLNIDLPSTDQDRVAWNKSWEDLMDEFYNTDLSIFDTAPHQMLDMLRKGSANILQLHILTLTERVCDLQRRLNLAAIVEFTCKDLENVWSAYTQERREEIVLEALFTACSTGASGILLNARTRCPELSVKVLAGNDGKWDFISLLKRLLPDDQLASNSVDPIEISSEKFDSRFCIPSRLKDNRGMGNYVRFARMERCNFMTETVWCILNIIRNFKETFKTVRPLQSYKEHAGKEFLKKNGGPEVKAAFRDAARTKREVGPQTTGVRECRNSGCRKNSESLAKDGLQLRACARCKAIGRSIWYCSQECQKADWKSGFPVPHKSFCGKVVTEDWQLPENYSTAKPAEGEEAFFLDYDEDPMVFKRCSACGRTVTEKSSANSLKACTGCKAEGRSVWYCSRDCQLLDWKSGIHKSICGKRLGDGGVPYTKSETKKDKNGDAIANLKKNLRLAIPRPDASYKRPPALLYQIQCLTTQERTDYVVICQPPEAHIGIRFSSKVQGLVFSIYRYQAMKTGNKAAVEGLYRFLYLCENEPTTSHLLKAQLEREYGVVLDAVLVKQKRWNESQEIEDVLRLARQWGMKNLIEITQAFRDIAAKEPGSSAGSEVE